MLTVQGLAYVTALRVRCWRSRQDVLTYLVRVVEADELDWDLVLLFHSCMQVIDG